MKQCKRCGAEFSRQQQVHQHGWGVYCSFECRVGPDPQLWLVPKGRPRGSRGHRFITTGGYVGIQVSRLENKGGFVLEHRRVMEQSLGRQLTTDEQVHHIDGNRQNNEISNLVLMTNAEHQKLHAHGSKRRDRVQLMCAWCAQAYEKKRSRLGESLYCSNACRLAAMHEKAREYHAVNRPAPITCQQCGTVFQVPWNRLLEAKYCSRACANAAARVPVPEKTCEVCGTTYHPRPDAAATSRFCSRACLRRGRAEAWRGSLNPRWKG